MEAFGLIFKHLSLFLLLLAAPLFGSPDSIWMKKKPPSDAKILAKVTPYVIPESHPAKKPLNNIFSASRVLKNLKTLRAAGFEISGPRKFTRLIVASHFDIPGYIFKLYIDAQRPHKNTPEYEFWILRIQGARLIQEELELNGWQDLFKVPQKWIYQLPSQPAPSEDFAAKNFILVEDDMGLYPDDINKEIWKSDAISETLLTALFYLLKKIGLHDCVKPDNIPFSVDGRVAFVDTQTFHEKVSYKEFASYLSPKNQKFWKNLILNNQEE